MSKRKLLLADDSETVQKVVNLTFELEGIEVITFGDGDSAMQQLSAVAPDVVLADVNMPGISGYEICQKIKENEATRQTPVILLVGSFEPFDEEKAMQVGADDYLTKPFQSIRQLVSKVNELLSPDVSTFAETLRMEERPYSESEYGDPGMDDEMIETIRVESTSFDETAKFPDTAGFEASEDVSGNLSPDEAEDRQFVQPAGQSIEEDLADEQTVYELAEDQTPETEPEPAEDQPSVEAEFQTDESYGYAGEAAEPESGQFPETSNEEFGLQPDDIDHYYKEPDYEDEEIGQDAAEVSEPAEQASFEKTESAFEPSAEPAEESFHQPADAQAFEGPENETRFYEGETRPAEQSAEDSEHFDTAAPDLNFDEFDLLEVPYPEALAPAAEETVQPAFEQPPAETPVERQTADEDAGEVKQEVARQMSGISLSPEDIEAIADRVVEKLTARMKE